MRNIDEGGGQSEALLSAATAASDMRTRSQLIGEAAAARMAILDRVGAQPAVPALEDVMDELAPLGSVIQPLD
jgi:hypothetical protein